MRQFTEGALFAGVMGFGEGFRRAAFQNLWAVEKEPFCQAVIRSRFQETEIFSDVHECGKHNLAAVDVLTFGFPCQDLSVAGKRAGLAGTRSGLFWEAVRIVGELRPRWFLAENVPGLFSSSEGEDFTVVLRELGNLGYGVAWRVLNSQFFGVAQRRRRVFIVGCLGKPCPAEVLFEPEGGEGDFAESGEARPGVAAPLTSGVGVTGNAPGRRREDDYNLAYCLREDPGGIGQGHNTTYVTQGELAATLPGCRRVLTDGHADSIIGVAHSISASNGHHGHSSPRGDGSDNLVTARTLTGSCWKRHDEDTDTIVPVAIQDVRGQRDKKQNGIGIDASGGPMYTLDGTSQHAVASLSGMGSGGPDDNDGQAGRIVECAASDPHRMRSFTELPALVDLPRRKVVFDGKEMRAMWCDVCQKKKAFGDHAGHCRLSEAALLQRGLCPSCISKAIGIFGSWKEAGATAYPSERVRDVRSRETVDPRPQGREHAQQLLREHSSSLPQLPHEAGMATRQIREQCEGEMCFCGDSARYRALGNAVTVSVSNWIALRIKAQLEKEEIGEQSPSRGKAGCGEGESGE